MRWTRRGHWGAGAVWRGRYLSVAVLAGLGGGHLDDLAGATLQHHVAVLAQSGALHGIGFGGAGLAAREVKIGICHGAVGQGRCRRHRVRLEPLVGRARVTPVRVLTQEARGGSNQSTERAETLSRARLFQTAAR